MPPDSQIKKKKKSLSLLLEYALPLWNIQLRGFWHKVLSSSIVYEISTGSKCLMIMIMVRLSHNIGIFR